MADATVERAVVVHQDLPVSHTAPGAYEAPLFGAYSKKVGMWLFLASDSLTRTRLRILCTALHHIRIPLAHADQLAPPPLLLPINTRSS